MHSNFYNMNGLRVKTVLSELLKTYVVLLLFTCHMTSALRFTLPSTGKRCLKEEIHKNALVKGDYELSTVHGHHTTVKVGFLPLMMVDNNNNDDDDVVVEELTIFIINNNYNIII